MAPSSQSGSKNLSLSSFFQPGPLQVMPKELPALRLDGGVRAPYAMGRMRAAGENGRTLPACTHKTHERRLQERQQIQRERERERFRHCSFLPSLLDVVPPLRGRPVLHQPGPTQQVPVSQQGRDVDVERRVRAGVGQQLVYRRQGAGDGVDGRPVLRREQRQADLAGREGDVGMADGRCEGDLGRVHGIRRWHRDAQQPEAVCSQRVTQLAVGESGTPLRTASQCRRSSSLTGARDSRASLGDFEYSLSSRRSRFVVEAGISVISACLDARVIAVECSSSSSSSLLDVFDFWRLPRCRGCGWAVALAGSKIDERGKQQQQLKTEDEEEEEEEEEEEDRMRTSRVSREAAKVAESLTSRRRAVKREEEPVKEEEDASSGLSSPPTTDIEDLLAATRKRKRAVTRAGRALKAEVNDVKAAKAVKDELGDDIKGPPNWQAIYDTVKRMRERNPTAPVDTMGCSELYWRSSSPRDRRFHTLIALMLSSQTKDTVTAATMLRLHTQLTDETSDNPVAEVWDRDHQKTASTLTLENMLAVSPERLNELIRAVGFHNNKTRYIKATAEILRDKFDSDIPSTVEGLISLPGVGPKMAYLCMSSAWSKHEGIGVDVHVHRITNLWGWNKTKTPEATRAALESWLPRDKWHEINKLLVGLGQTVCLPVGRRCAECDLSGTGLCIAEIKGKSRATKKRISPVKTDREEDVGFPEVKESKIDVKMDEEADINLPDVKQDADLAEVEDTKSSIKLSIKEDVEDSNIKIKLET